MTKFSLFQNNPTLLVSPYQIQSPVSLSILREFLSALEGNSINITDTNFTDLQRLSQEFGFSQLAAKLSEFRSSIDFKDSRGRIATLEEKSNQHSHIIAIMQDKLTQLSTDFERLVGEISSLRSTLMSPTVTSSQNQPPPPSPSPSPPGFDSRIISDFPEILAEFREKHFNILWRGSYHGFSSYIFHRLCNDHTNTLTVILDTNGNIFGGFTPTKWESGYEHGNPDFTLKSFLFTLKNPHNIAPRRFRLNPEMKHEAIWCSAKWGPHFNGGIAVSHLCNENNRSATSLGLSYINDTGLDKKIVLAGSYNFQVKEIEVFEITD
jgi:hypothetical protein